MFTNRWIQTLIAIVCVSILAAACSAPRPEPEYIVVTATSSPTEAAPTEVAPTPTPEESGLVVIERPKEGQETCEGNPSACEGLPVTDLTDLEWKLYSQINTPEGACYALVFDEDRGFAYFGGSYVQVIISETRMPHAIQIVKDEPSGYQFSYTLNRPPELQDWEYKCETAEAAALVGDTYHQLACFWDLSVQKHSMKEFSDFISNDIVTGCPD